jgi:hypothetical protein
MQKKIMRRKSDRERLKTTEGKQQLFVKILFPKHAYNKSFYCRQA